MLIFRQDPATLVSPSFGSETGWERSRVSKGDREESNSYSVTTTLKLGRMGGNGEKKKKKPWRKEEPALNNGKRRSLQCNG